MTDEKYPKGSIGVWNTYYDQVDPLMVMGDDDWEQLTLKHLGSGPQILVESGSWEGDDRSQGFR